MALKHVCHFYPLLLPVQPKQRGTISRITVGDSMNQDKIKQMWTRPECNPLKSHCQSAAFAMCSARHRERHAQELYRQKMLI